MVGRVSKTALRGQLRKKNFVDPCWFEMEGGQKNNGIIMENFLEIHHEKWFWKWMKMRIHLFPKGVSINTVSNVFLTS